MFALELKDSRRTVTIESSIPVPIESPLVRALVDDLDLMNAKVPLTVFSFIKQVGPDLLFDYKFRTVDARTWKQTILFQEGVTMTFDVTDRWRLEEFILQRPIRDGVITMVRDLGVEKVRCTYGP